MLYSKDAGVEIRIYKNFTSPADQLSNRTKKAAWEGPAIEVPRPAARNEWQSASRKNGFFLPNKPYLVPRSTSRPSSIADDEALLIR